MVLFGFGFLALSLLVMGFEKVWREIDGSTLQAFYPATAVSVILLLYGSIFLRYNVLERSLGMDTVSLVWTTALIASVLVVEIFLLTRGRRFLDRLLAFLRGDRVRTIGNNLLFLLVVFLLFSLAWDLHMYYTVSDLEGSRVSGDKPNVLLISIDTLRADHMSLYGYHRNTTPNIDRFSEDAAVFDSAIATSSWTLPSHASMFTGLYSSNHGAVRRHQHLDDGQRTMAEVLRKEGYTTAAYVSGGYVKGKFGFSQGFQRYKDRLDFFDVEFQNSRLSARKVIAFLSPHFNREVLRMDGERSAEETTDDAVRFLEKNSDQSFFLFVHYFDPHNPYLRGNSSRYTSEERPYSDVRAITNQGLYPGDRYDSIEPELVNYTRDLYDAEVRYTDRHLGRLFDKLQEEGLMEDTVIIVTSDHGEEFYEHGGIGHGHTLYQEVVHVPLIIRYPEELRPQRVEERVSLVDIYPTVMDVLNESVEDGLDGRSLLSQVRTGREDEDNTFSELFGRDRHHEVESRQVAVFDGRWKLIEVRPGRETVPPSLFDLGRDPGEQSNLYSENPERRETLLTLIRESGFSMDGEMFAG